LNYKECYVAFIDILGFSEFVENNDFERISKLLYQLDIEKKCTDPSLKSGYDLPYKSINVLLVSDSIILSIDKTIDNSLDAIIWVCSAFQASLLLNQHMIMRGAISCGDFYIDGTILFGKAYLNAYTLERKYRTPRIIIDKSIDVNSTYDKSFITKDNKDGEYFVDYMESAMRSSIFKYAVSKIKESIICNLNKYKYEDRFIKYDWLKDYYNKTLQAKNEYLTQIIKPEDIINDQS
jgi:small basic protein